MAQAPKNVKSAKTSSEEQQKEEKPEEKPEDIDFDFQPARPTAPVTIKKKPKFLANIIAALAPINMNDDEDLGNPSEGLSFPAPADVRAILKKRIPEIIANYENLQSESSTKAPSSEERVKMEDSTEEKVIASDFTANTNKTLKNVRSKKKK